MSENKIKIGIFGGAFDPPHIGHLIAAQYAAEELDLHKVIFVPSGKHPFKQDQIVATADQRHAMTKLAVAGNPLFEVSDYETNRSDKTYSVDTLEHFRNSYPLDELFFFIGKDNVAEFEKWKNPERILALATVVVLDRINSNVRETTPFSESFMYIDTPTIEVSSSEIRKRISEGKSVRYLIRNGVELFIDMTGLYGNDK